ncbi:MAG: DUF5615 family PIN-like protein [Leptospiraceae bacterium]|nr:DUF5615 family PIN-like protein [Leptospiraceae bacterium]MCP5493059.1 DUF5615 family PIN-like protein [Leptospiraceae bacterium]
MEAASDAEIIKFARENQYACITLDADFHSILVLEANNKLKKKIEKRNKE